MIFYYLGFTTSVWWSPCCSSWFHHQCLVGSVLLILVSPPVGSALLILVVLPVLFFFVLYPTKHWWWNQDEQHRPHQTLVVKPRWATQIPPNTGDETKVSNTDPTKHWCHHQCLVRFVLLILVSPPVFGGVRVAHLCFTTSFWWGDPTKHWWWNEDEQHRPHQTLVVKPRWATRTLPNTGGQTKMSKTNPIKHW
jgi:hypothetical protein